MTTITLSNLLNQKNKVSKKRIKALEKENEKLREALIDALMPLYTTVTYYGRASLKNETICSARDALRKARTALEWDSWSMSEMTGTDEDEWDEPEWSELDAWIASKEDKDDDD